MARAETKPKEQEAPVKDEQQAAAPEPSIEEKALEAAKAGEVFEQKITATLEVTKEFAVGLKGEVREFAVNQVLSKDDVDYLGEMVNGRIDNGFIKVKIG